MKRLTTVAIAVALALLAAAAPAAARRRGPDLRVSAGKLAGDPFVFYGGAHQPRFTFTSTTVNSGSAGAGPTQTAVYLEHAGRRWRLATRSVPALGPGGKDRGQTTVIREPRLPLGGYTVTICADARSQVAEASEGDNCKQLADHFFVVATDWTGKVSGTSALGPLFDNGPDPADKSLERWSSSDADFFFDEYEGDGRFSYKLTGAHFSFSDGGIDGEGCSYSGGGSSSDASGSLAFDYLGNSYTGLAGVPEFYPIHVECPGPEGTRRSNIDLEGPYQNLLIFDTTTSGAVHDSEPSLSFGAFKVADSSSIAELGATWSWDLAAAKP